VTFCGSTSARRSVTSKPGVAPRNELSSLIVVCPISRNTNPWAFKVEIQNPGRIRGAILVDQVRSLDRQVRFARRVERVGNETLERVYRVFSALFGIPVSS
jgi:mRNA interferase MazF